MRTILLLAGGSSNERDVSLRSGDNVEKALTKAGHKVVRVDPASPGFNLIDYSKNVDAALIALHGAGGEDGVIQQQLDLANIPYKTSSVETSELCWDKWSYKQLLIKHNVPVSRGILVSGEDMDDQGFRRPFVLKPINGGSTLDMVIARKPTEKDITLAHHYLEKYDQMLLEELVEGTEVTIAVLGETALPVIEIIPPDNEEFDYENKYNGASQELAPAPHVNKELQAEVQELALRIHKLTGSRGMSRTDMIIDKSGQPYVLETNTIPGLTEQSLLPKAAAAAGISMEQVVSMLI
jgi:D-alanine-D-alanine ligase